MTRAAGPAGDLALAAAVGGGAYLWLAHVNAGAWTGHDQTTGLLMAQDCLRLATCHLTSVDSGLRGFTNGAVWLHLLTAVGLFGGGAAAVRATLRVLMAAGIAAVFLCTRRWLRPAAALPAALFALAGVTAGGAPSAGPGDLSASNLVDASAAFLPTTLCACALLIFVLSGRPLALVVAAVLASHAMNTHVAAAGLVPALVAAAALAARWPLRAAALAVAAHVAATLVTSPVALRDGLAHLSPAEQARGLAALAAVAVLGRLANARYRRLGVAGRAGVLAAALVAPLAAGAGWLLLAHRELSTRYLAPVIAPLAVAAAALLVAAVDGLTGRRPRLAVLTCVAPAAVALWCVARAPSPRAGDEWTYEDGRVVAAHLARRGWCYSRQFARLQTPRCTPLTYAVMPYACHAAADAGARDSRQQLRAWLADRARPAPPPRNAEVLATGAGRAVVLSEVTSWLDTADAELCITPAAPPPGAPGAMGAPAPPGVPGERTCRRPEDPDAAPFLYSHRLALGFRDAMLQPPFTMAYAFPVRPDAGQTHRFAFPDDVGPFPRIPPGGGGAGCGWQVTQVEGLEADRPLPANPVRLTSRDGAPGRIVIERVVGGAPCMNSFPGQQVPCLWETTPDDPAWMQEQGP